MTEKIITGVFRGVLMARDWFRRRGEKGQNTVEYLMMLALVAGVAIAAGMLMKKFMPQLFGQIQGMISGAAGQLGSGGGN